MSLSSHDLAHRARLFVGAAALVAVAVPADARVTYSLGLDAQALAASNPLLLQGDDLAALLVEGTLRPAMVITDDTGATSVDLGGALTGRAYSRRYGQYLLGDAHADVSWRHSEHLLGTARAEFRRDISADTLTDSVDAALDPRSTRNAFDAALGLTWAPTPRDTLTPNVQYQRISYASSDVLGTTSVVTGDLAYNRRLNERTSLGVRGAVASSRARAGSEFLTYSLYGTLNRRLTPILRLTTDLGAEHSREDRSSLPIGVRRSSRTSFSGRVGLCAEGTRMTGCVNGGVSTQISALGELQRSYTASINARRPIGTRQSLSLAADYQRAESNGSSARPIAIPPVSAASVRGAYDWRLAEHLTLSASLEYRRREFGSGRTADGGTAGIMFRWQR